MTDPAADWPTLEHVPVYDTHHVEKTDRTGAVVADEKVTRARLEKIAATRNARIETTGNLTPIIIGHSRSDLPEWAKEKWSPTVGYGDRYEVGERETDGRPVMYARMRLRPESTVGGETLTAEEIVRRFPCPSIERVLHADGLDAISLLHPSNPPARELGLIRMAAAADPSVAVSETPPMDDKCQALATAIMQVLEQFLNGGGEEAPPAAEPVAPTPAQYARPEPELEKVRMQREQEAIRNKRMEAELAGLKVELATQKLQYQRERREKDLIQREAEGIELDRAEELDRLAALPDDVYAKELARIDLRYQRSPAGSFIRTASVSEGGTDPVMAGPFAKVPHHDAAHAYMMAHPGMQFHTALEAVKAGK